MTEGRFITLEGGEGTGKSTQAALLAGALRAAGHDVVVTREPGGVPGAEAIRSLLVTGEPGRWTPLAEALLFAAARDAHLRDLIEPSIERGALVISDRFADSTRAYQGAAGGVSEDIIGALESWVVANRQPDLTFVLDLDPEIGIARSRARGGDADRFERHGLDFHRRLREAFLDIAEANPSRCIVVDASRPADDLAADIARIVAERIGRPSTASRS